MTQSSNPEPAQTDENPVVKHWRSLPRRTLTIGLSILPLVALINVGVLIWSLGGIDLSEKITRPGLLGLAAALVFVPMIANSLRIALWARFLELDLSFRQSLKVISGTMVANSVTPSAAGGAAMKLLFLMGERVGPRRSVTLLSFQAAEDTFVTFALAAACLGFTGYTMVGHVGSDPALLAEIDTALRTLGAVAIWSGVALVAAILFTTYGLFGKRVRRWAGRFARKAKSYLAHVASDWAAVFKRGKGMALINLVLTAAQWMVRFSVAGLILAAFGVEWQAALFWLLQYIVHLISSIIPTPGGAGGAEAGFLLMFAPFVAVAVLVPAMSTWRLMHFYLPLIGAAITFFLLYRGDHKRAKAARLAHIRDGASDAAPDEQTAVHPAE